VLRRIALGAVPVLLLVLGTMPAAAKTTTALHVAASNPPEAVFGSDGREHVEYDLVLTNAFSGDAALGVVSVRADDKPALTLAGDGLAAATHKLFTSDPTATVAPGSTAFTQVDLVQPRSAGRTAPKRITNRVAYALPADAPSRTVIGSTVSSSPVLRTDPRPPVVISAPLSGAGWVNVNGCCNDPTSPHRETLLASDGDWATPELFAIDWVREVGGRIYNGDGSQNTDWVGFGEPIHAVADGTAVVAVDGKPDIPPMTKNPGLRTPEDYAGNNVVIAIGHGRYAVFDHLVRGSVRVRRGQRVRAGQVIGKLGNSGNTDGPHLHFGIETRPDALSQGLPFEIDDFVLEHTVSAASPGRVTLTGTPTRLRRAHPLIRSVATFTPAR
jgi:murein DD-endopeptidase MepM/ murein hydrolase activator NlpD